MCVFMQENLEGALYSGELEAEDDAPANPGDENETLQDIRGNLERLYHLQAQGLNVRLRKSLWVGCCYSSL